MTTSYIYGETLQGTVDGVNKVFTSLYAIDSIEDMIVGGSDYRHFSYSSGNNIVTLTDAPSVIEGAPIIDYFRADVVVTPSGRVVTLQDIIDEVYEEIGQDQTTLQYPLSLVKRKINEGVRFLNNMRVNPKYKTGGYSFNKAADVETTSYTAGTINTSPLDSYVPSSGKVMLAHSEVVDYTTKLASGFTGLTNLNTIYGAGEKVIIGYKIPDNVKKVAEVLIDGNVLDLVDRREFAINIGKQWVNAFTIVDNYIFLPFNTLSDQIVTVNYTKPNIVALATTDTIDFEEQYSQTLVYYTLKQLFRARQEDDRLRNILPEYNDHMRWYRAYIRQVDGINSVFPSSTFSGF